MTRLQFIVARTARKLSNVPAEDLDTNARKWIRRALTYAKEGEDLDAAVVLLKALEPPSPRSMAAAGVSE